MAGLLPTRLLVLPAQSCQRYGGTSCSCCMLLAIQGPPWSGRGTCARCTRSLTSSLGCVLVVLNLSLLTFFFFPCLLSAQADRYMAAHPYRPPTPPLLINHTSSMMPTSQTFHVPAAPPSGTLQSKPILSSPPQAPAEVPTATVTDMSATTTPLPPSLVPGSLVGHPYQLASSPPHVVARPSCSCPPSDPVKSGYPEID